MAVSSSWTVDALAEHLRAVLSCNPDAVGGTTDDRVKTLCRMAGIWLWNGRDWRFRRRSATISIAAGTTTAELPTDFAEIDARVMRSTDDYRYPVFLTEDEWRYQEQKDFRDYSGLTDEPAVAIMRKDAARGYPYWYMEFFPTASEVRTYAIPYITCDPWSRHGTLATSCVDAEANLVFTAVRPGAKSYAGTSEVTVAFTAGVSLAVSVSTYQITITFVAASSTAAAVRTAVRASAAASALVHCDYAFGKTGTGKVEALAATALSGAIADSSYPDWPRTFDEGWEFAARWRILRDYRRNDDWTGEKKMFDEWMTRQLQENDETITLPGEPIEDAMGDFEATARNSAWRNRY